MGKILATPRSFGKADPAPITLLEKAGYEVILNPVGRILSQEEMKEYIRDVEGVVIGVDPLNADVLAAAQNLKAIAKYGVGTDNIDLAAAQKQGVKVSITQGANSEAVADYAFALMAACARKLVSIDKQCRNKDWQKVTTTDISRKKLGILGLGAIGKNLARRAQGFDMQVLAYDPYWDADYAQAQGIQKASPKEIYKTCDFISLHLPLTEETRNMISQKELAMMKKTAVLINTARGGLIDEEALIQALKTGQIYAAGIDAFSQEPPGKEDLYQLDNLIMGSHCAASTEGAVNNMGLMAAQNLLRDLGQ